MRIRMLGAVLAAMLGATAAAMPAAMPAQAVPADDGAASLRTVGRAEYQAAVAANAVPWYYLVNYNSGLVLAVSASSDANGAAIIQWGARTQSNGLPALEQAWTPQLNGNYNSFLNAGTNPWKSFGISGSSRADGAKAIQWTYSSGNYDQQWSAEYTGPNVFMLVNRNSGKCLAIPGGNRTAGTQAVQWTCNPNTADQQWFLGQPA